MQKHTFQPNKKIKIIFIYFYLNASKARKEKYRQAKTKKNNFGLITNHKESDLKNHTITIVKTMTHTCLKTRFYFYFFDNVLNEKKQAKGKINPKLLTVQTKIQTSERNNSYQGKE
jgi:hypothetical protein